MDDPFIITTDIGGIKPKGDTRRLIRRHVMKGKNKKSGTRIARGTASRKEWLAAPSMPLYSPITSMDLATMGFPTDLEPYMVELITRYYVVVEETGSPLANCTQKGTSYSPYDLIYNDPAHLHIVLFMAQTYFDSKSAHMAIGTQPMISTQSSAHLSPQQRERPRQLSSRAVLHMTRAIEHLQHKLADPDLATSLSAIFVVLCLGTCAEVLGDFVTAEKHRLGLRHLIEARGGIATLDSFALVQLKCCRFDISLSLKTRRKPLLMPDISWKAHLLDLFNLGAGGHDHSTSYLPSKPPVTPLHNLCLIPDARLVNVWTDLAGVCRSFKLALKTGQKVEMLLSSEVLVSVMYRLLYLEDAYSTAQHDVENHSSESGSMENHLRSSPHSLSPSRPSPDSSYFWSTTTPVSSVWSTSSGDPESHDCSDLPHKDKFRHFGSGQQNAAIIDRDGAATAYASEHELIRLGMLAFTTTIFFDTHGLETVYIGLYSKLACGIPSIMDRSFLHLDKDSRSSTFETREKHKLELWIIYIVYVTFSSTINISSSSSIIMTGHDTAVEFMKWLHGKQLQLRAALGLKTWAHTRDALKSFLWVEEVHNGPAKLLYDLKYSAMASGQSVFEVEQAPGFGPVF